MLGKKSLKTRFAVLAVISLFVLSMGLAVPRVYSQSQTAYSSLYVTPVQSCCVLPNATDPTVTVQVMMNLTSGDSMNGFDVRLNYTHWYTPSFPLGGVVKAVSLDSSNNVWGNLQSSTQASCIDDVTYGPDGFCATDDLPGGQVHMAQTVLGTIISGPLFNQKLFSITFTVNGTGTSVFSLDRANLGNPGGEPPNPHFLKVTTFSGVFGNEPLVAFFDYKSTSGNPTVISGKSATLDGSDSFRSTMSGPATLSNPVYNWNFGDGSNNQTGAIVQHVFAVPGNYTVSLTVTDDNPGGGSVQRIVPVLPPLGGLYVTVRDQNGGALQSIVVVQLLNFTTPPIISGNGTITVGGVIQFKGLTPGFYTLKASGDGVDPGSKTTEVSEGWTTQETLYLTEKPLPGPNDLPLILFGGIIIGGLTLAGVGLFSRRRKMVKMKKAVAAEAARRKPGRR